MSLSTGTRLGPYEIQSAIGAGGMGEVYQARDTRLDRTVAIKVLPADVNADAERRARFEREARAASALNHPNLCTIYDIGSAVITEEETGAPTPDSNATVAAEQSRPAGGEVRPFIAMEWIDGVPLSKAMSARGGLPIDTAIGIACQLAAGMAAAHAAGIIHRDIKPANVLLRRDGVIKVVDFGLAKMVAAPDAPLAPGAPRQQGEVAEETITVGVMTQLGSFLGTPGYASPEQARGTPSDARTDVFAIGCVLYELFTGRRAFAGDSGTSPVLAVLESAPASPRSVRRAIPQGIEVVIQRCLEKAPERRYLSGEELLADLEAVAAARAARRMPLGASLRRPVVVVTGLALLVALAAGVVLVRRQRVREQWVRGTAIPQAKALLAKGEAHNFEAFRLLRDAERLSARDPQLQELMKEASNVLRVSTTPQGARLFVRDVRDTPGQWEYLGRTPLSSRLPGFTPLLMKASLEGFAEREVVTYSNFEKIDIPLVPRAAAPPGMVYVPGGRQEFNEQTAELAPFWMDRTEVTNRAFEVFVQQGGYNRREYWAALPRGIASQFVDRSGRQGPATWTNGAPADGQGDHPVAGVSYYEASAFCRSVGKSLPTFFHWYKAAEPGMTTQWASLGNFQSNGTEPVAGPRRINAYGTYDMAGNVREWTSTEEKPGFRYALGGGFSEPSYTFRDVWVKESADRSADLGFRCASYPSALPPPQAGRVTRPFRDYRLERPASDEQYAVIAAQYDYDAGRPLDAREESTDDENSQYRLQRVSFAAAYATERIRAFVLLPKNADPPWQVVVWYTGGYPFQVRQPFTPDRDILYLQFLVRSGRAVLFPELKGSYERRLGEIDDRQAWREIMIHSGKDLRRAVDYVKTRPDLDGERVAFYGLSMGAAVGGIMTAIEPRFKASILLGGGLHSRKRSPESDVFNFLPRVHVPTLMINGKHDYFFPHETSQKPMFDWLGTSKKRQVLYESGHMPTERDQWTAEILHWLDEQLGPVRTR